MMKQLFLGLAALGIWLCSAAPALAWCKFNFSAGINMSYQGANNSLLWGAYSCGPSCGPFGDGGYGGGPSYSPSMGWPDPYAGSSFNFYQPSGHYAQASPQQMAPQQAAPQQAAPIHQANHGQQSPFQTVSYPYSSYPYAGYNYPTYAPPGYGWAGYPQGYVDPNAYYGYGR